MRLLILGGGGGLDSLTASYLYFAASERGHAPTLGAIKRRPVTDLRDAGRIDEACARITPYTEVVGRNRYAEPLLARHLGEPVLYFTHQAHDPGPEHRRALRESLHRVMDRHDRTVLVDAGGDALVLRPGDAPLDAEHTDPFLGGDAYALEAVAGRSDALLAQVAVGVDIRKEAFCGNAARLIERGRYFGAVDTVTGIGRLDADVADLFRFSPSARQRYLDLADAVLVRSADELADPMRRFSHAGTAAYHAIAGNVGEHRTFAPWAGGSVTVTRDMAYMHFLDAGAVHPLKLELQASTTRSTKNPIPSA